MTDKDEAEKADGQNELDFSTPPDGDDEAPALLTGDEVAEMKKSEGSLFYKRGPRKGHPRDGTPVSKVDRYKSLKKRYDAEIESGARKPDAEPKKKSEPKVIYDFPRKPRCPGKCKTQNNVATSTQGPVQYRKCMHPICGITFKVTGVKRK